MAAVDRHAKQQLGALHVTGHALGVRIGQSEIVERIDVVPLCAGLEEADAPLLVGLQAVTLDEDGAEFVHRVGVAKIGGAAHHDEARLLVGREPLTVIERAPIGVERIGVSSRGCGPVGGKRLLQVARPPDAPKGEITLLEERANMPALGGFPNRLCRPGHVPCREIRATDS